MYILSCTYSLTLPNISAGLPQRKYLPRPLHTSYVVRRRTILASSNRRDWPADRDLHEALTHGSLALELMSSSDKTPARQSPFARLIFLLTFRHLYEISSFQLTSSAKLVLAYPNLGSIYYGFHSSILTFYTVFNTAMFTPFEQSADERQCNKNFIPL